MRRGCKKAIMEICYRLLVAIYHVPKKNEAYNPELYQQLKYVTPDKSVTIQEAAGYTQSHDFTVI